MELTKETVVLQKEKLYFRILVFFAILIWIGIFISVVGIAIAGVLALLGWLANGLFVAHLKSECVQVSEQQLPPLYQTYTDVCHKLSLIKIPELYIMQSHGMLNAFALRHAGRNFVVINSDLLETYGQESDEIRFLIGHEIGHIERRHIAKSIFLAPAMLIPLIGSAYHRACEATCDRFGAFVTKDLSGAIRALMILSGGKEAGKLMNPEVFAEQTQKNRGFFISWHELISGYPTLSQRISFITAIKNQVALPKYKRHPLAYVFALFSFGGGGAGSGNAIITVMVIAMLSSIAIPNILRAKLQANATVAETYLKQTYDGLEEYAADHHGKYPTSLNALMEAKPPVISVNYCGKAFMGYKYTCELMESHYKITATPEDATTGMETLIISSEHDEGVKSKDSVKENSHGPIRGDLTNLPKPGSM